MERRALLATSHPGEVEELTRILVAAGWAALAPAETGLTPPSRVLEGATLRDQAIGRATAFAGLAGMPALAVASAFNVYAMGQEPGLRTHDYAGEAAADADHRAKLLTRMKRVPTGQRIALFQVAIAIATPGAPVKVCNSTLECEVAMEERGGGGYLFDAVTQVVSKRTLAELDDAERDRVSHRGMAMKQVVKYLEQLSSGG